jgi:hypothetical protein
VFPASCAHPALVTFLQHSEKNSLLPNGIAQLQQ